MRAERATLGGGCFWCLDAVFRRLEGVIDVTSGYAGGDVVDPSYEQVVTGKTGHAEVVEIEYDADVIDYEELLRVFFSIHDPTTVDRQGNDVGTQYRSIILWRDEQQRTKAVDFIRSLESSGSVGGEIVTQLEHLNVFYPAEGYHQDYHRRNPWNGYCRLVIQPKIDKLPRILEGKR